jgi:hypothetical protein
VLFAGIPLGNTVMKHPSEQISGDIYAV